MSLHKDAKSLLVKGALVFKMISATSANRAELVKEPSAAAAYKWSLGHTCTRVSIPKDNGQAERTKGDTGSFHPKQTAPHLPWRIPVRSDPQSEIVTSILQGLTRASREDLLQYPTNLSNRNIFYTKSRICCIKPHGVQMHFPLRQEIWPHLTMRQPTCCPFWHSHDILGCPEGSGSKPTTAIISRVFICHMRWLPLDTVGWRPWKTVLQPTKEASMSQELGLFPLLKSHTAPAHNPY